MQKSVFFLEHPILVPVFFIYPWRNRSRVRVFSRALWGLLTTCLLSFSNLISGNVLDFVPFFFAL